MDGDGCASESRRSDCSSRVRGESREKAASRPASSAPTAAQRRAQSAPKVALRVAVYVHHGAAAAPRMKSVAAMKVSSTQGSWRWPVASQRRR